MSFLDYLKEHRGQFIDHRTTTPALPCVSAADLEVLGYDAADAATQGGGPSGLLARRRRPRTQSRGIRFRHVEPVFTRSAYSDPLPYEETWERAFR